MTNTEPGPSARADRTLDDWDTGSATQFFEYYEEKSNDPGTVQRFTAIRDTVLRCIGARNSPGKLDVLDVGCGAGTQSRMWSELGHRYVGVDINEPLIQLARQRAVQLGMPAQFEVGTATELPFADSCFDVSVLPELLEHVADWKGCLNEAARVLRPGGVMYVSTSNKLCPLQQEFNLPLYSWYPRSAQRYFERRASSDWPQLVNYAKYPAVHWFSYYALRDYLEPRGFACSDRFDLVDVEHKGRGARTVLSAIRSFPPLRLLGQVATPYTVIVATKTG